jgi:hypothetical protein
MDKAREFDMWDMSGRAIDSFEVPNGLRSARLHCQPSDSKFPRQVHVHQDLRRRINLVQKPAAIVLVKDT